MSEYTHWCLPCVLISKAGRLFSCQSNGKMDGQYSTMGKRSLSNLQVTGCISSTIQSPGEMTFQARICSWDGTGRVCPAAGAHKHTDAERHSYQERLHPLRATRLSPSVRRAIYPLSSILPDLVSTEANPPRLQVDNTAVLRANFYIYRGWHGGLVELFHLQQHRHPTISYH